MFPPESKSLREDLKPTVLRECFTRVGSSLTRKDLTWAEMFAVVKQTIVLRQSVDYSKKIFMRLCPAHSVNRL